MYPHGPTARILIPELLIQIILWSLLGLIPHSRHFKPEIRMIWMAGVSCLNPLGDMTRVAGIIWGDSCENTGP